MRQTDNTEAVRDKARGYAWRAVMYKTSFDGLLQGTMGNSFKYNEPVWDMIKERIPVSLYFRHPERHYYLFRLHSPWGSKGNPP